MRWWEGDEVSVHQRACVPGQCISHVFLSVFFPLGGEDGWRCPEFGIAFPPVSQALINPRRLGCHQIISLAGRPWYKEQRGPMDFKMVFLASCWKSKVFLSPIIPCGDQVEFQEAKLTKCGEPPMSGSPRVLKPPSCPLLSLQQFVVSCSDTGSHGGFSSQGSALVGCDSLVLPFCVSNFGGSGFFGDLTFLTDRGRVVDFSAFHLLDRQRSSFQAPHLLDWKPEVSPPSFV